MMRAAIYARYSSDLQNDRSIEDQVRICREYAEREGWEISAEFSDYAISGASTLNRPQYQDMVARAIDGAFDVVIAEDLDRLSRDMADTATLYKRLEFAGVALHTVAAGVVDTLQIGFKSTMSAEFLKNLALKTRRGLRGRVEKGAAPGGLSYGYRIVRPIGADGEVIRGQREIDPEQAEIVRRIFREYRDGRSPVAIVTDLNAERIPGPRGNTWSQSTLNGSRKRRNGILHNELYIGMLVFNRQTFRKNPDTGRRVSRPNPPDEWITTEVPHLRIIDDETWDAVQAMKQRLAGNRVDQRRRPKRLLSGLLVCGACGGSYTVVGAERVGCSNKRTRGTCDNGKTISLRKLEARVLAGLQQQLLEPDAMAECIREYHAEMKRLAKARAGARGALERERADAAEKVGHIVTAIEEGFATDAMKHRLLELEGRIQEIDGEMAGEPDESQVVKLHPRLADSYRETIAALRDELDGDPTARREAATVLRSLIDKIVLTPHEGRGALTIELHGRLAALMNIAQGGAQGDEEVMLMMVAGAGFEPATFRL